MSDLFEQGHACVIGVGGDLPSTVDDAKGFAKILKDPDRCAYPESQVQVLTGEQATRANIINALETLASTTNPESTVLVYFSGHGYQLSGAIKSYFLMPHGYDSKDLSETAISGSEFVGLLRGIPAQKLLVLLDCCHAGGLSDLDGFQVTKAPLPPEATKLFARGGGKMIIGSSMPDELSFAAKPYSVFTYALIKGLCGEGAVKKDGYVRANDLAMYASRIVPSLTNDKQHPVLNTENMSEFVLAYYSGGDLPPKGLPKELEQPLEVESEPGELNGYVKNTIVIASGDRSVVASNSPNATIITGDQSFVQVIHNIPDSETTRQREYKEKLRQKIIKVNQQLETLVIGERINILKENQPYQVESQLHGTDTSNLPTDGRIIDILNHKVVGRRLLILGEMGSGKTQALSELARSLTDKQSDTHSEAVPVIFSLSRWEGKESIFDWIVSQLAKNFERMDIETNKILLNGGEIIPLLDDLDELPPKLHVPCIKAINSYLKGSLDLVVCCRSITYENIYKRSNIQLQLNAAICLQPLIDRQISDSLQSISKDINHFDLFPKIQKNKELFNVIRIPIFLTYYINYIKGSSDNRLHLIKFETPKEAKDTLIDIYVDEKLQKKRYDNLKDDLKLKQIKQVKTWLTWLSKKMTIHYKTGFSVEDLQPSWLLNQNLYKLGVGLLNGTIFGVVGFEIGSAGYKEISALGLGITFGIGIGISGGLSGKRVEKIHPSYIFPIFGGLIGGLLTLLFTPNLLAIFVFVLIGTSFGVLINSKRAKFKKYDFPNRGIFNSFISALFSALIFGTIGGLLAFMICRLNGNFNDLVSYVRSATLSFGLIVGLVNGGNTCIQHLVIRLILWVNGMIPWNYTTFLRKCTQLRLLELSGSEYRFSHSSLRDYFAGKDLKSSV